MEELAPGIDQQSDEQLLAYMHKGCHPLYHAVGTCKMGCDVMAVVDDRLRVHGISGLRIADASILPNIISGNSVLFQRETDSTPV